MKVVFYSLWFLIFTGSVFAVQVSLPDTSHPANDTILVPIITEDLTGLDVYSFETTITSDSSVATPEGATSSGSISSGWGAPTYSISGGKINIAMAGIYPLSGSGSLVYIKFISRRCTAITETTALYFDNFMFNEGNPVDTTNEGSLIVTPPFKVRVWLDSVSTYGIDTISIPIKVDTTDWLGIYSYEAELSIDDTNVAKFYDVVATQSITQNWGNLTYNLITPGNIIFADAGSAPLSGNDTILVWVRLHCWNIGDTTTIRFNSFKFNEKQPCDTTIGCVFECKQYAVELFDFSVVGREGYIELSWWIEDEIDNYMWLIVRADKMSVPSPNWEQIAELPAKESLSTYQFIDSSVIPGITYWYKLGDVDNSGNIRWYGPVSAKAKGPPRGVSLQLGQPIPSPSKGRVKIEYQVSTGGGMMSSYLIPVTLEVYSESGQLVKILVDEDQRPGRHIIIWDSKDKDGNPIPAGTYFYSLKVDGKLTRKLIYIK